MQLASAAPVVMVAANPRWLNANATGAIQLAINDAQKEASAVVYLPAGTYQVSPAYNPGTTTAALRITNCSQEFDIAKRPQGPTPKFICMTFSDNRMTNRVVYFSRTRYRVA